MLDAAVALHAACARFSKLRLECTKSTVSSTTRLYTSGQAQVWAGTLCEILRGAGGSLAIVHCYVDHIV